MVNFHTECNQIWTHLVAVAPSHAAFDFGSIDSSDALSLIIPHKNAQEQTNQAGGVQFLIDDGTIHVSIDGLSKVIAPFSIDSADMICLTGIILLLMESKDVFCWSSALVTWPAGSTY